jgi:beta-glucosidase
VLFRSLSYTDFKFSDLKLSSPKFDSNLTASVTVSNTGSVPGREVVQLYLTAPKKKIDKPAIELKAFAKTGLLKPGESQTLTFKLSADDLASFDTRAAAWVADAGKYTVKIGGSSLDIKQTVTFDVAKDIVTSKVRNALTPLVTINEMKSK